MEAGERWMLNDVMGKPIRAWDSRGHHFRTEYDRAPPARASVCSRNRLPITRPAHAQPRCAVTSESSTVKASKRHRAEPTYARVPAVRRCGHRQLTHDRGLRLQGQPAAQQPPTRAGLQGSIGLAAPAPMDAETYRSSITYDALNRPITITTPDAMRLPSSTAYNEANLLDKVEANLRGARGRPTSGSSPISTTTPRASAHSSITRTAPKPPTCTTSRPSG